MPENSLFNSKIALIFVAGIILGFIVGFALANRLNREEQDNPRASQTRTNDTGTKSPTSAGQTAQTTAGSDENTIPTLTDEQLKNAVTKADASPDDAKLQKQVGQALYVYAWEKSNTEILPDVARILKRAHDLDPKDFKTTHMAGDAYFLIARSSDDTKSLADARKLYEAALSSQPDDAEVRTKLGMTYFYDKPSDPQRAIREYRRALQKEPRNEMTLQNLAAALIETGGFDEAERNLGELEKLSPSNKELASLRAHLEQKRNAAKEKR
jgi:tetratricopeptide (TPR) repeat protein